MSEYSRNYFATLKTHCNISDSLLNEHGRSIWIAISPWLGAASINAAVIDDLLAHLLQFHTPWLLSPMKCSELSLTTDLIQPLLNPWERESEVEGLKGPYEGLAQLLTLLASDQFQQPSILLPFIALAGIMDQGAVLLSTSNSHELKKMVHAWTIEIVTRQASLESILDQAAEWALQTPQSFVEHWETILLKLQSSPSPISFSASSSFPMMSVAPEEVLNILFRRASLKQYVKSSAVILPPSDPETIRRLSLNAPERCGIDSLGTVASVRDIRSVARLGINLCLHGGKVPVLAEVNRLLDIWDICVLDCRTETEMGRDPMLLKNSLQVTKKLRELEKKVKETETEDDTFFSDPNDQSAVKRLVDHLDHLRGRYIGFIVQEPTPKESALASELLQRCLERGFSKVFYLEGGWPALKQEVCQLPVKYHAKLLSSGAASTATWMTNEVESVKAFVSRETEMIVAATDVLVGRFKKLFTERPSQEKDKYLPFLPTQSLTSLWNMGASPNVNKEGGLPTAKSPDLSSNIPSDHPLQSVVLTTTEFDLLDENDDHHDDSLTPDPILQDAVGEPKASTDKPAQSCDDGEMKHIVAGDRSVHSEADDQFQPDRSHFRTNEAISLDLPLCGADPNCEEKASTCQPENAYAPSRQALTIAEERRAERPESVEDRDVLERPEDGEADQTEEKSEEEEWEKSEHQEGSEHEEGSENNRSSVSSISLSGRDEARERSDYDEEEELAALEKELEAKAAVRLHGI